MSIRDLLILQAKDFAEYGGATLNKAAATMAATALTADQARLLIPGLGTEALLSDEEYAALLIQGGLVLDSHRYLRQATASFTGCHTACKAAAFRQILISANDPNANAENHAD